MWTERKLAKVWFKFKKSKNIIDMYEKTSKQSDERFQSVYAEGIGLTNKLNTEEK